ncbi:MAG: class I SAM-dependent methyltransferase [Nannocystaceae bacterium]
MGMYDEDDGVDQYLELAEGYDGAELVEILARHVDPGATVLELGMGPGKDLALLHAAGLRPTGSDASQVFLRRYREGGGTLPTLWLDACTLDTDERFDAIYSNKVLQHLTHEQLRQSLSRQAEVVRPGAVLLHALWYGQEQERCQGLLFTQHDERSIAKLLPPSLEQVEHARYAEMADGDSLWVLLRRRAD